jgi:hypothetical protein
MSLGARRVLASAAIIGAVTAVSFLALTAPAAAASGEQVLTWGRNQYGQLGNGATNAAGEPVLGPVSLPRCRQLPQPCHRPVPPNHGHPHRRPARGRTR